MTSNDRAIALALGLEAHDDVAAYSARVANSPSSAPVRRDVPVISGVAARIFSTMCSWRSVSASAVPPGLK